MTANKSTNLIYDNSYPFQRSLVANVFVMPFIFRNEFCSCGCILFSYNFVCSTPIMSMSILSHHNTNNSELLPSEHI